MAGYIPEYMYTFVDQLDEHPWLFAGLASILVGLSGILPLLIIPLDATDSFTDGRKFFFNLSTMNVSIIFRFFKSSFMLVSCQRMCRLAF